MKNFFKEPLLHFLLIGAGLFLLHGWMSSPVPGMSARGSALSTEIVVPHGDIRQLTETFERTWQRSPTEAETNSLIEGFIRDEIYYREALAAGLDQDDSVIRRRLRLKMEFLFEDIAAQGVPTEQDLRAFMEKHSEKYRPEPQVDFRHVFVNADRRGAKAEAEALKILAQLNAGEAPDALGDSSLLPADLQRAPIWEIQSQFGEGFSNALLDLEPGGWKGPLRSSFGLHLVRLDQLTEGRLPPLDEVREIVQRDWAVARQQELKDAAYARLRERYSVVIEPAPIETSAVGPPFETKALNR